MAADASGMAKHQSTWAHAAHGHSGGAADRLRMPASFPTLQLSFLRARMVLARCCGLNSASFGIVTRKYCCSQAWPGVYCQQARAQTISLSAELRRWLSLPLEICGKGVGMGGGQSCRFAC